MKKFWVQLIAGLFVLGIVETANATLIGDTVFAQHNFSFLGSPYFNKKTAVVTDDATDTMFSFDGNYSVDVNADSISILFQKDVSWYSCGTFNGIVVWDLDDSTDSAIQAIDVSTSMTAYDTDWVTFTDHQVNVNWDGLAISKGTTFSIDLDYGGTSPVPEPSTMILLGFGLLGLAGICRKKLKK